MDLITPPPYFPIQPITISSRWFPEGRSFGLYESGGVVAPNVTSILASEFPFDRSKWEEVEPGIDHDAVTREAAERGTAVHQAMEDWLAHRDPAYSEEYAPWVHPLRQLVAKAQATLAVEVPVHHTIPGAGAYAGSADGLVIAADGSVVIIDYKTKRPNKKVHPRFQDKQRTQLAAYSLAINDLYADQLPHPVTRTSLLFGHPEPGRPPTVISTAGAELMAYQERWIGILSRWHQINGPAVREEQEAQNRRSYPQAA